jgi:predicted dinucleotide-binding enzyme
MKSKVAIVGKGEVGRALERGLQRAEYEVRSAGHDPGAVRSAADWADAVILAVPFSEIDSVIRELGGAADDKPVVDVTNPVTDDMQLALGFTTSAAEQLQRKMRHARVVKCFNTVFARHMADGHVKGKQLSAFAAGEDADARATVLRMARGIGFDPVDSGPLANARWLETLGYFNIQLGAKMGPDIGFELVH